MTAIFKNAWGYQGDPMNLPVASASDAVEFYTKRLGFRIESSGDDFVVLERDGIRMKLVQNGGDPTQDGCAFQVGGVDELYSEYIANGVAPDGGKAGSISPELKIEKRDDGSSWKVFFIVAPDGLCYWFGEQQSD